MKTNPIESFQIEILGDRVCVFVFRGDAVRLYYPKNESFIRLRLMLLFNRVPNTYNVKPTIYCKDNTYSSCISLVKK